MLCPFNINNSQSIRSHLKIIKFPEKRFGAQSQCFQPTLPLYSLVCGNDRLDLQNYYRLIQAQYNVMGSQDIGLPARVPGRWSWWSSLMLTSRRKRRKVCLKKLKFVKINALKYRQPTDTIGKECKIVVRGTRHLKRPDLVMVEAKNGLPDKRVLATEFPICVIDNARSCLWLQNRSGIPQDSLKCDRMAKLKCMFLNQRNLILNLETRITNKSRWFSTSQSCLKDGSGFDHDSPIFYAVACRVSTKAVDCGEPV